jgi:hypothetical protein
MMMVFLLVVATLLAPVLALVFADWRRERKRRQRASAGARQQPGWVSDTKNCEETTHGKAAGSAE